MFNSIITLTSFANDSVRAMSVLKDGRFSEVFYDVFFTIMHSHMSSPSSVLD